MNTLRVTVLASSTGTADELLGVLPDDVPADVMILGTTTATEGAGLSRLPARTVLCVDGVDPTAEPGVLGPIVRDLLATTSGPVLLASDQPSRDLAGWLAVHLDAPLIWAIDAIRVVDGAVEADRVVLGGSHRMTHRLSVDGRTLIMGKPAVAASALARVAATPPELADIQVVTSASRVAVTRGETAADAVPLAGARVVVSVGRGIGGPEHTPLYAELARALGAALGASRVAVDAGWMPFSSQVGQTGSSVAPEVYLAFGISGAIQHLAGIRGSRRIVAVNTDLDAPISRHADMFVHGDANTVASAVLAALR